MESETWAANQMELPVDPSREVPRPCQLDSTNKMTTDNMLNYHKKGESHHYQFTIRKMTALAVEFGTEARRFGFGGQWRRRRRDRGEEKWGWA